jgi:hypothetical protein
MYGYHPDTVHESAAAQAAELRKVARRRERRVALRARSWRVGSRAH